MKPTRQRGAALLVSLMMLVMLTLVVMAAIKLSGGNLRVVGNIQHRDEAIAAANMAIEQAIAINFPALNPPAVFQAVTGPVDIDRDGTADFTITVAAPTCLHARIIPTSQLNAANPNDQGCFLGTGGGAGGLSGAAGTQSFCADTLWELRATAGHARTGADVTIRHGISRRLPAVLAANLCG